MDLIALKKLERYCAYQERCQWEVRSKLIRLKVYGDDLEEIIAELIATGFLDESRFAGAFVRGKFRNNRWGKIKIRLALQQRGIASFDIDQAIGQLDDDTYLQQLHELINKKFSTTNESDHWTRKNKIIRYAQQKGYELPLILQVIEQIEKGVNP